MEEDHTSTEKVVKTLQFHKIYQRLKLWARAPLAAIVFNKKGCFGHF